MTYFQLTCNLQSHGLGAVLSGTHNALCRRVALKCRKPGYTLGHLVSDERADGHDFKDLTKADETRVGKNTMHANLISISLDLLLGLERECIMPDPIDLSEH